MSTGDGPRQTTEDANRDVVVGRGQLLFTPSESTSALFIADYARRTENCCGAVQINDGATAPLIDAVSADTGVSRPADPFARVQFADRSDEQEMRDMGLSAELNFETVVRQDHLDHRVAQFRIDDRPGRRLQHGRRAVAKYRRSERQRVQATVRGAAFLR